MQSPSLNGRPAFGPSCTYFVYPGCLHFDNGETSKIDDVLTEHGGLRHVLSLALGRVGWVGGWLDEVGWVGAPHGF